MHGNLQDIDLSSLLNLMESQQKSGVVFIEQKSSITNKFDNFSFIFFSLGKIIYAGNQESFSLLRLEHYLTYYNLDNHIEEIKTKLISSISIIEYEGLLLLNEKQIISYQQQKEILSKIIQECLFENLSVSKGFFTVNFSYFLQPQIYTFSLEEILPQVCLSLKKWQQFTSYSHSSAERIIIKDWQHIEKFIPSNVYQNLSHFGKDKSVSFQELARYLHADLGTLCQIIKPHFLHGVVDIENVDFPQSSISQTKNSLVSIFCITDDQNWALSSQNLLNLEKHTFTIYNDINEGLKSIFREQPQIILFALESDDLSMYNFCKILRNIPRITDIPIILIVENFVFAENLRAKMSGATEYTTKKNIQKYLLHIIEKYTAR